MALYLDIFKLRNDRDFTARIEVATIVAAEEVRVEPQATANNANRVIWARKVFEDPKRESVRMMWAVLAANRNATIAQILEATDATLQVRLNAAVNLFADGS